jgi:putative transposase
MSSRQSCPTSIRPPPPLTWQCPDNGQAERLVRTIKEATVKALHYTSIIEMRRHVRDWLAAYNFAKQLKALSFESPFEALVQIWKSRPEVFHIQPSHHMLGLNTLFDPEF